MRYNKVLVVKVPIFVSIALFFLVAYEYLLIFLNPYWILSFCNVLWCTLEGLTCYLTYVQLSLLTNA